MLAKVRDRLAFVADPRVGLVLVLALGIGSEFASGSTVQLWSFVLINVLIAQSINLLTGVAGSNFARPCGLPRVSAPTPLPC